MAKNPTRATWRRLVQGRPGVLLVTLVSLVLGSGCFAGRAGRSFPADSAPRPSAAASAPTAGAGSVSSPRMPEAIGPEERARCGRVRTPVSGMVTWERLCRATARAASKLPDSSARPLLGLLTPHDLPTLATLSSLWLGTNGRVVVDDVVARAPLAPGSEPEAQRLSQALWRYVNEATFARIPEDLERAASALEEAVEAGGVDAVVFLLDEGLLSSRARLRDEPPSSETRFAVARSDMSTQGRPAAGGASAPAGPSQDTPPPAGCARPPPGWPDFSSGTADRLLGSGDEKLLAPFLTCPSPAAFVALQRGVDMARLVGRLEDWSAVRLGALGPVLPEATGALNRKRAAFLVSATQEYGPALAEVFALFVLDTAFDRDVEQVLRLLAGDKRLGQTLGHMATAREHLRRRGFDLADFPDRPERPWKDGARGARQGLSELLSSAPLSQVGVSPGYVARKEQLPPPYRHALDEVEGALARQALEPDPVLVGVLDELSFGVPLGFYALVAGAGHGVYALTQGQYEQATRELTPAALLVALYAGGKGARFFSEAGGLPGLEPRLEALKATAGRLREQLGAQGLEELARYLRADPEAALLVAEGGEAGAVALSEARGDVPRARAWLSEAKSDRPGAPRTRGGAGAGAGGVASLVDEAAGLTREVVEARFLEAELEAPGPRLSGKVAVLEKQLAALEKSPPAGAPGHSLWSEYLEYGRERLADLGQGVKVKKGRTLEPPLKWEGYQQMQGLVRRGLRFERDMAKLLREDAARPQAQRGLLQDFNDPRVETFVGVRKPKSGLRYADVLVIERKPLLGQLPRVETFSFKSRDFSNMGDKALEAQMIEDASEALGYYGETLDIRRPGLEGTVEVQRVRLIYEGGELMPKEVKELKAVVKKVEKAVPGVEVFFQ